MSNKKIRLRTVAILLLLAIFSLGARIQPSFEPSSGLPDFSDLSEMIESTQVKETISWSLNRAENLIESLQNRFGSIKVRSHFNENEILRSDSETQLGEPILNQTQYRFVVVNSTTIMAVGETSSRSCILSLINLENKTIYSKTCSDIKVSYEKLAMKLLDSNTVGIYNADKFLAVDISDLSIKQKIIFSPPSQIYETAYFIQAYPKNQSGVVQNTLVLGYNGVSAQVLEFNYKTNQYEKVDEVFKPNRDYYLTDSNEGISFWNYNKVPSNLRTNFKFLHKQGPYGQTGIVSIVSDSQEFVMNLNSDYFFDKITVQRLNRTTFELTNLFAMNMPLRMRVNIQKVRFSEENKYLFVNLWQTSQKYQTVGVVNIETAKITYFDFDKKSFQEPQCFDYGLLDNTKFVLVCEDKEKAPGSYQLRLHNLSNFKLLDTYSLEMEVTNLEIKTNPSFNQSFILQFFNGDSKIPTLQSFKIANNRIVSSTTNLTNFRIITDCLDYLVGIFGDEPYYSFINIKNFQVVRKTSRYAISDPDNPYGQSHSIVQKNILILFNGLYYQMHEFFDLSKINSPGDQWQICKFFLEYRTQFYFFLHEEMYAFERWVDEKTTIGFDLRKCPTRKIIPLQIQPQRKSQAQKVLYKRGSSKDSCNLAYIFYAPNLIFTFRDCEPYQKPVKTSIRTNAGSEFLADMRMSSNSKYIILIFGDYKGNYRYDVRPVNDLERSVHRTAFIFCKYVLQCMADVNEKDQIIYISQSALYLEQIKIKEEDKSFVIQDEKNKLALQ